MGKQVETIKYTHEKAKQNALAKLDLICQIEREILGIE